MSELQQSCNNVDQSNKSLTYNDIATKLLHDKHLLTALELHTELAENGKELRLLRDFFSNPGNFEFQTQETNTRISRSGSQATLDSLDLTRYSEDGAGTDERVAVLEFELRKAKDTINALRNNLTVATESETSTPVKGGINRTSEIKPHEQRALNFLINEYLLMHGYKLTSITFADENQSQDFDDWDDVGLNISKPPELLTLYREGFKQTAQNSVTIALQVDLENEKQLSELIDLQLKITNLETENCKLKEKNSTLEKENMILSNQIKSTNSKDSLGSESPERFEIIDKNMSLFNKNRDNINIVEDNLSNNSFNTDWMNVTIDETSTEYQKEIKLSDAEMMINEPFKKEVFSLCYVNIPQKVDNELLDKVLTHSVNNETLIEILSQSLLRIIPNIILNKREEAIPLLISAVQLNPNSNERDKLLQQLFNLKKKPSDIERLMILTGLVGIAKFSMESLVENEILPQCWEQLNDKYVERRLLVAEACIALIPYVSSPIRNSLILSILQQMLEDKEDIVRETVIRALSLVFALCEDTDKYSQCEELAMNVLLNDSNQNIVNLYVQILFPVIGKWALSNGKLTSSLLKRLLHRLNDCLKDVEFSNKFNQTTSERIIRIINVLENLLPFLLISVADCEHIRRKIDNGMAIELSGDFLKLCTNLTNPAKFHKSELNVGMICYEFNKQMEEEPKKSWVELDWILDMMIPDLLNNLSHIEVNYHSLLYAFIELFSCICIIFGKNFTKFKIAPIFRLQIMNLEQILTNLNQFSPTLNIIPVYLVSVLSYCDNSIDELFNIFKKFLYILPLCGTPLDCLEITVEGLCGLEMQDVVVQCLWEGVVHQRPLVRAASANLFSLVVKNSSDNLISTQITPALVTLASDNDLLVKTATIPALGSLITDCNKKEVHDKVHMQLQTYLSDSNLRENHTLLRQLIVTLGSIVNSCSPVFRQEVILPQLSSLSSYMMQISNQTRKIDLVLALIEAFSNVIYNTSYKHNTLVMPGLRCIEAVVMENQQLISYRDTVQSMIRECDIRTDMVTLPHPIHLEKSGNKLSQNMNQGIEEMRQRVSKIFQKPIVPRPNLHGIFKK